jgi:DNA repair exonuclease SbcCD ATPase subunit
MTAMPPLERFRQTVDEYSKRVEDLEQLSSDYQAALNAVPPNTTEAERLKGEVEALLVELKNRKESIATQQEQLEKERDRAAQLIA